MTVNEAALRLGRSVRSVHYYLEKGFLTRKKQRDKTLIPTEDVEQLAIELGTDLPALTRRNMFDLLSRVKKLEEQMAMVQAVWGIQEQPLRPNPNEAAGLYKAATDYLTAERYHLKELETWAGLLNQFDEQVLGTVAEAAMTTQPWEVFYQLSQRLLDQLKASKELKTSLHLQALHTKLHSGRKKVREAALLWVESGRGTVPNRLFKHLDTPREDLLRSITGATGNS